MQEISLNVPSIGCSVCSNKITTELKGMNGIEKVNVDLKTQSVNVSFNQEVVQPQDISRKIAKMGYEVQG